MEVKTVYFGNINNDDFNERHETIKDNIKISLTDLLSNDLFRVETTTMASKTYYKIIPLFYYDEVTCTDTEAKIMDRLIICQSKPDTILKFISPHIHQKHKIYTTVIQGINQQYYYHIRILDEWGRPIPNITCKITNTPPDNPVTTIGTETLLQIDNMNNKGDFTTKYNTQPASEQVTSNNNGLIIHTTEETEFTLNTTIDGNNYIITTEVNQV